MVSIPQPQKFVMYALGIGLAYDWTVVGDEAWSAEDFVAVLVLTYFARQFV